MSWPELLQVAGLSLAITAAVGGASVLVLLALRRSSLIVQVCVLVFASLLSVVLSMVAASWMMYLSAHDLTVAVNVAAISGTASLALVAGLGAVVVRNTRSLSRAARRIGAGERLDAVGRQSSAEFDALARELLATSTRLAESRDREQRMDESRRELVAWIAHDLRTPLAGIMSMAEALEDDLASDPSRYHRQMREQVARLSALVDDLFELSKIDSGALRLSLQEITLYDVISDAVADLRAVSDGREIRIDPADDDLTVLADPRQLSRAVSNLLVNAVQHTPQGAPITVATSRVPDGACIAIVDAGEGIHEEDLDRIFDPGWRGAAARTPQIPATAADSLRSSGAGLGLAIVRGIAVAHGGSVTAQNVPGGCRFELTVPIADQPAPRISSSRAIGS
ncbi:sensor histidine kinase KdpD [Microbacterium sp. SLBN-146]|uniref:sensor histidine kinase n=1 Tax=Microbacterium sp. SLBN-146 TaxID=2768457 RepID=UPI00114E8482|nr:HAMP domain-containing sensor histidine kinase [Microbacterium sp. SLBN-146]TQJ30750.1 histidine kinase [Microbacterium sp. SLBN-146]